MANVTARERADAIVAKHRDEFFGLASGEPATVEDVTNFLSHLRDDIENAINAMPIDAAEDEAPPRKRNTTHMPSSGHDKHSAVRK